MHKITSPDDAAPPRARMIGASTLRRAFVVLLATLAAACAASNANSHSAHERGTPRSVRSTGESLIIEGTRIEGGAPHRFSTTLELATGLSLTREQMGLGESLSGYDGMAWRYANGIIYLVDVPAQVRDARARAFVESQGWRRRDDVHGAEIVGGSAGDSSVHYRPTDGSAVEIVYDSASGVARRAIIDTEYGSVTTTYDDWRSVGTLRYPFRQVTIRSSGLKSVTDVESVRDVAHVAASDLARPAPRRRGRIVDGDSTRVVFTPTGARQTHIRVPARISGRDAALIFDTGGYLSLTFDAAKRLGLALSGGVDVVGAGPTSSEGAYATVDRVSLGSAELRDQTLEVGPSPFPAGTVDGLAGYEFLYEFRTTLDYAAHTLTFASFARPAPSGGVTLPFYSDENLIYVAASVDAVEGLWRLDTGAGNTITISPSFARNHGILGTDSARVTGGSFGGEVVTRSATLPNFSMAGVTFANLPVQISQATVGGFVTRSIAGNIGAGVLQCFRMTFDYRARTVQFEPQLINPNCAKGAAVSH